MFSSPAVIRLKQGTDGSAYAEGRRKSKGFKGATSFPCSLKCDPKISDRGKKNPTVPSSLKGKSLIFSILKFAIIALLYVYILCKFWLRDMSHFNSLFY